MSLLKHVQSLTPDEKGIVIVDGRKFIKEKLIAHLERNGAVDISAPKKKRGGPKMDIVRGKRGEHKRVPVIAITPDGKEIPFESSAQAATVLKICRTNIPHALSGKYDNVEGYKFKYAK